MKKHPIFNENKHQLHKNLKKTEKDPCEILELARNPLRPKSSHYIKHVFDSFEELHGDRLGGGDDPSIIGGLAKIDTQACVVIGQEKGFDTDSRIYRKFGMTAPSGFRKANRLAKIAEKFSLPLIHFIDTPGADPTLESEIQGQGFAISKNMFDLFELKTPIVSIIIGEGCSGGALALAICDKLMMLENSYFTVISPESCSTILFGHLEKKEEMAKALKFTSYDLFKEKIIDQIIFEEGSGAHEYRESVFQSVKSHLLEAIEECRKKNLLDLLENRHEKFRLIGKFTRDAR